MRSIFPEKMPKAVMPTVLMLTVLSFLPLSLAALSRATPSIEPRVSIIPDMDDQEKFRPQEANPMFVDGRAMRAPVVGTVAYGQARIDDAFYRGIENGQWVTEFPIQPTVELVQRGQQRFNIYCAPCHGYSGYGNGMVAVRAEELQEGTWVAPSSLHDELVRSRPVGHIFNSITNGIRNMPPYGPQIPVHDRWAIVMSVKSLQRSRSADISDVPAGDQRSDLESKRAAETVSQQQAEEQAAAAERAAAEAAAAEAAAAETSEAAAEGSDAPADETAAPEEPAADETATEVTEESEDNVANEPAGEEQP